MRDFLQGCNQRLRESIRPYIMRLAVRVSTARRPDAGRVPGSWIIMPPAESGSLGDRAMLEAALDWLTSRGAPVCVLAYDEEMRTLAETRAGVTTLSLHDYLASMADTRRLWRFSGPRAYRRLVRAMHATEHFLLIGADVLDGAYWRGNTAKKLDTASLAAACGCHTTIGSFSYRSGARDWALRLASRVHPAARIAARDPLSAVQATAAFGRQAETVADLSLLLGPDPDSPAVAAIQGWLDDARAAGRPLVGLAPSFLVRQLVGSGPPTLELLHAVAEELVARTGVDLLLIPHDGRGAESDYDLCDRLAQRLPPDRVATTAPEGPRDVKALLSHVDLLVTARMHAGLGAISVGTPARFLDYQGKVKGLGQHLQLPDVGFEATLLLDPPGVGAYVLDALSRTDADRARIVERLPELRGLAARNLAGAGA